MAFGQRPVNFLYTTLGAVVNGPCLQNTAPRTVIVASKSSPRPRVVTCTSKGVLSCESSCPDWAAIRICSHSIAAAHFRSELTEFLEKYCKKKCTPNLTHLSKVGMPKGAGRKGDKPPHKRRCPETVHTFASTQSSNPSVSESKSTSRSSTNIHNTSKAYTEGEEDVGLDPLAHSRCEGGPPSLAQSHSEG